MQPDLTKIPMVTDSLAWNYSDKEKAYKATLGGNDLTISRDPKTGNLIGRYFFDQKEMKVPLHDLESVAQARIALPARVLETLSKRRPEFYNEIVESAEAARLKAQAVPDERI